MNRDEMLDPVRTAIFNAKVKSIEGFVFKKYGYLSCVDELKQTMLLEYAIALAEADLGNNYKSYCWRRMVWAGNVYLNKLYKKEQHLCSALEFDAVSEPEQLTSRDDDCNARLNIGLLVERMGCVFDKLSKSEQHVVTAEFDSGMNISLDQVSYDKRKRIARHFKKAVLANMDP